MNEIKIFNSQESLMTTIHSDGDMICLTDLWKENGSIKGKNPNDWMRLDSTQQLADTVANILNTAQNRIINSKKGKGGGTWAHKQIALAYAKYLDPKLHVLVNSVFFERIEEEKNPGLSIDRGIKNYQKQGKSLEWIEKRISGKVARNEFTATLARHGVVYDGYKNCTNGIYTPFWGGSSDVVRVTKNLDKKQSIRDNMTFLELTAISLAEQLAAQKITQNDIRGNGRCEMACKSSATLVATALLQNKKAV